MESMEEIYQNHSKKVYTFLLSKTCNHELAEELTQETFFCAVNSINKFKGNRMAYRSFENDSFWSNSVPYLYDYYVYNQEKAKQQNQSK